MLRKNERGGLSVVYIFGMNLQSQDDHISIHGLGLVARVGVPALERATPQRLAADITLWPTRRLSALGDDLAGTIDYAAAAEMCRAETAAGECQLIETLAERLCFVLLSAFPLQTVRICLRKFILPDTDAVSVSLTRRREDVPAPSTPNLASP